jgi:hypothetical protein
MKYIPREWYVRAHACVSRFILEDSEEILKTFAIRVYAEGDQIIVILVSMGHFNLTLHKALIESC